MDSGLGEDVIVLEKEVSIRRNSIRGREVFSAGVFGGKGTAAKTGTRREGGRKMGYLDSIEQGGETPKGIRF